MMLQLRTHRTIEHVWSRDPALDTKAEGFAEAWKKFLATGDLALLPLKNGARPVVWTLASLKREHKIHALSDLAAEKTRMLYRAGGGLEGIVGLSFLRGTDYLVSVGLTGVRGLQDETGRPVEFLKNEKPGQPLAPETMEKLHLFGMHFINELGFRVLEISEPDPTSGQD